MSKKTLSSHLRKVDVKHYRDEPDQEIAMSLVDTILRGAKVKRLVEMGNLVEALVTALESPPMPCKEHLIKKRNAGIVLDVLARFRPSEIKKTVAKLDNDQIDTLVKYVYRGFEEPTDRLCAILLVWHQHAVSSRGLVTIVRVLTSCKTV